MRTLGILAASAALSLGAAACTVQTRTTPAVVHGYTVVEADNVPADFSSYPHTRYDDRDVYLVNGRWYYPSNGGQWVVFNDEPPPLYDFRARMVVGGGGYGNGGYASYGQPHVVQQAPPAYPQGPAYPPPPPR